MGRTERELKVFIVSSDQDFSCSECREPLISGAWITLTKEHGALCLACADLDHLLYLPSGNAALTRRARRHAVLSAVVLKWSRARKRYERQGVLVEQEALELAERECLHDGEARARRREREAIRRAELDEGYVKRFASKVRELFPSCPPGREETIAEHACLKSSGRIGRSAAAKVLDLEAVRLAVVAHLRHCETRYDELLATGHEKGEAREQVQDQVALLLAEWGKPFSQPPSTRSPG